MVGGGEEGCLVLIIISHSSYVTIAVECLFCEKCFHNYCLYNYINLCACLLLLVFWTMGLRELPCLDLFCFLDTEGSGNFHICICFVFWTLEVQGTYMFVFVDFFDIAGSGKLHVCIVFVFFHIGGSGT